MRPLAPPWVGYLPPILVLLVFGILASLWAIGDQASYRAILAWLGMYPPTPPFLDMHAVLSALECHAAGMDVMVANPCDIQQRPHVYGSLWLWLSPLRLDRAALYPVGLALDLLFIAGLFALPRARLWGEFPVLLLAFASPAVFFALERANNDIVVWLLTLIAVWLVLRQPLARGAAYAITVIAALLKFYPAVMLVLLGRERLARALAIGLPLAGLIVWVVRRETAQAEHFFRYTAYHTDAFGAWNIAYSLLASRADAPWQRWAMIAMVAVLTAYALSLSVRMVTRFSLLKLIRALPEWEAWLAMAAGSMLVACFFAGPSIAYRGILLLLVLPAMLALRRGANDRPTRLLLAGVAWVIVWCLWSEAIHNHVMETTRGTTILSEAQLALIGIVTGLRELAWWWLISVLMALVGCIGLTSPAGTEFCRLLGVNTGDGRD